MLQIFNAYRTLMFLEKFPAAFRYGAETAFGAFQQTRHPQMSYRPCNSVVENAYLAA
jgi:hypothetical protein